MSTRYCILDNGQRKDIIAVSLRIEKNVTTKAPIRNMVLDTRQPYPALTTCHTNYGGDN